MNNNLGFNLSFRYNKSFNLSQMESSSPPMQDIKIHTDRSSFRNPGASRFWSLLRDEYGNWITGFMELCGFTTNMETRLFGIFNGLKVAKAAGFHIVNCESNSQITLKMIFQGVALQN